MSLVRDDSITSDACGSPSENYGGSESRRGTWHGMRTRHDIIPPRLVFYGATLDLVLDRDRRHVMSYVARDRYRSIWASVLGPTWLIVLATQ